MTGIIPLLLLLTAVIGLITAIVTGIATIKKLSQQQGTIQEIKVSVNGNLQAVKDQLAAALTHMAELDDHAREGHLLPEETSLHTLQKTGVLPLPPEATVRLQLPDVEDNV